MQQVERILNASGNIYYLENDYLNTELVIMSNELLFRKVKENYIYEDSKSKLVGEQFEEGDYIFLRVKEQLYLLQVSKENDQTDSLESLLNDLEKSLYSLKTEIIAKNLFF